MTAIRAVSRHAMVRTSAVLAVGGVCAAAGSAATSLSPVLRVTPLSGLLDAPLQVEATGLRPGARVGLVVSGRDAEHRLWRTRASRRADEDGRIRLDAGGLLPVLQPADPQFLRPDVGLFPSSRGLRLRVDVLVGQRLVASSSATRLTAARTVSRRILELRRDGLVGRFSAVPSREQRPAVMVLGGSEGGLNDNLEARLLAARGYPTLELAYFGVGGLPAELKQIRLEYLERGLRWLARLPGVRPDRIVVLGASRGAELALLLGARFPELVHGVAAYAPSSVVYPSPDCFSPAWTQANRPLQFAPCSSGRARPPASVIPVEKIRGPILLVAGANDLVWPSGVYAREIADRLREKGKRDFSSLVYGGAGHAVAAVFPYLPMPTLSGSVGGMSAGGDPVDDARARTHAWAQLVRLLERSR